MKYIDFSDGNHYLYFELYFKNKEKDTLFGVFNFQPMKIKEDIVKKLIEDAELENDLTIEEFYYEFIERVLKGIDLYVNSSHKREDYFQHYYEEGTFKNILMN